MASSSSAASGSASVIHYRFKTAQETNSLRFEGLGLRVFDIKVRSVTTSTREGGRTSETVECVG